LVSESVSDLRLELPCDQMAPGAVRRALADRADSRWFMGDVMLVASELVANAVVHSGCRSDDVVSVELRMRPDAVLCSVSDPHRTSDVADLAPEDQVIGGFGLRMVEELAERWGTERERDGRYRVWAEVAGSPRRQG
jgi:anti-sigma regulatory factor (Ser/Thr protein kinase)